MEVNDGIFDGIIDDDNKNNYNENGICYRFS